MEVRKESIHFCDDLGLLAEVNIVIGVRDHNAAELSKNVPRP
jgi:hypothetical protein